jgi:archaellum biogenesis ATPase FlaH
MDDKSRLIVENAPEDIKRSVLGDVLEMTGEIPRDGLQAQAEAELQKDILAAALKNQAPEAALARVAKYHGLPLNVVQDVASSLLQARGIDMEAEEFSQAIAEVKRIEETIEDQGLREWKLQSLARKWKRSPSQLRACYEKALINQAALQPLSVSEFKERHDTDLEWLIPGWIPRSTTLLLHADGGVGKTLFAYQVMECVLKGIPWNGYHVNTGKCLLVQCDEPGIVTAERIEIRGIDNDAPLRILSNWQAENLPRLAQYIEQERPDLIIIDSLTTINKACTFSENDTEYARPLLHLRDLANDYGATVIIIHHSNAGGSARGTRAIHNSVSEVWSFRRGDTLNDRTLRVEKTRLGRPPGDYRFQFNDTDFTFYYLGEGSEDGDNDAPTEERVRLYLSEHPGTPYASEELAEVLSIAKNTARKVARELWAKGLCKRQRPASQRFYSYYVESSTWAAQSDPSDPGENTPDHLRITCSNPDTARDRPPSDPSDPTDRENFTIEKPQNPGSLGSLPDVDVQASGSARVTAVATSDPPCDPACDPGDLGSDHLPVIENAPGTPAPEVWKHCSRFDAAVKVVKVHRHYATVYLPGMGDRRVKLDTLGPLTTEE